MYGSGCGRGSGSRRSLSKYFSCSWSFGDLWWLSGSGSSSGSCGRSSRSS